MTDINEILEVSMTSKRYKGERYALNEYIQPKTLMVKELVGVLKTPAKCFQWVVEEIKYPFRESWPAWSMRFADLHLQFRHPPRPKISLAPSEFWKFPSETIRDKIGDCEDGAFLLASMLRALGEPAWVVLGTVAVGGNAMGHAWVENRGELYETTRDSVPSGTLPTTAFCYGEHGRYNPELKVNETTVKNLTEGDISDLAYWHSKQLKKPKKLQEWPEKED